MQFTSILGAIVAFSGFALASPTSRQLAGVCPGIDSPLCCELSVDGLVAVTCESGKQNGPHIGK